MVPKESDMTTTYGKGTYVAEVLEQGFTESTAKGTPGFFLQVKIIGRYDVKGEIQECPQFERTWTQWLANETGVNILRGDLKALGAEITDLTQLDPALPGHVSLVGRKIDLTCDLETFQGKQRERWGVARRRQKLDLTAVRALNDRFGHLLRDGRGESRNPGVAAPNDSDIPF
jgi:hypothetical protein